MAIRDRLMSALSQYGQSMQLPTMSQDQNMMFDLYANRPDFAQNYYPAVESQQRVALANRQENRLQSQQEALAQLAQRLGGNGFTARDALAQLAVAQGDPTGLINYQIKEEEKARELAKQNQIQSVLGGAPIGINPAAQNPYVGAGNPAITNDYSQIEPLISLDQPVQDGRNLPPPPPMQGGMIPQTPPNQEPQALKQLGLMAQLDPATYGDDYLKAKLAYEQEQAKAPSLQQEKKEQQNKTLVEGERDLRKEFEGLPDVKVFRETENAYKRIQKSAESPSPAGDIALLFNYMKMLDPASVVRESEFSLAANAAPLLTRLGIDWEKVKSVWDGKKLVPEVRADFLLQANSQYMGAQDLFAQRAIQYEDLAKQYNFDPKRIVQGVRGTIENNKLKTDFANEQEALSANLPKGTIVTINGRKAKIE